MTSPNSVVGILSQVIIYSIHVICIISAITGNIALAKVSDAIFIKKRSRSILFGLNASLIIYILSIIPGLISRIYSYDALSIVSLSLSAISNNLFLFFSITKSWMIYFKERWTFFTLQLEWQQHIAPKHDHKNWFILNNYRFGSLYYMYKVCGAWQLTAFTVAFIGVIGYYAGIIGGVFSGLLAIVPFFITIVIYAVIVCKTQRLPLMDDIFFIHWEAKLHVRILCIYCVIFIINQVMIPLINDIVLESFIFSPLYCLGIYALHHVSTYGILRKNYHYLSSTEPSLSSNKKDTNKVEKKIRIQDIMSNSDALHLFMVHMSKEQSMECLLAYIEMVQYQHYIVDTMSNVGMDDITYINENEKEIKWPSDVPVSAIVSNKYDDYDDEQSIKLKGYELYKKYIEETSEFEINIGWDQRSAADNIFKDKELLLNNNSIKKKDIFQVFDALKVEMFGLLRFSYSRFRKHPEHGKAVALFNNDAV